MVSPNQNRHIGLAFSAVDSFSGFGQSWPVSLVRPGSIIGSDRTTYPAFRTCLVGGPTGPPRGLGVAVDGRQAWIT